MGSDFSSPSAPGGPFHAGISTSEICNLRCTMCARTRSGHGSNRFMSLATFEDILERLPANVASINLAAGLGEPFLNDALDTCIAYAHDRGLKTICFTNGTVLRKGQAENIAYAGLDLLLVSVDSWDPQTYEAIRLGGKLTAVVETIEQFLVLGQKDWHGEVRLSKIVFPSERIEDLIEFAELSKKIGISTIELKHCNQLGKGLERTCSREAINCLSLDAIRAKVGINIFRSETRFDEPPMCTDIWNAIYFDTLGNLRRCCVDFAPGNPVAGDLMKEWSTGAVSKIRQAFLAGKAPAFCATCSFARTGG